MKGQEGREGVESLELDDFSPIEEDPKQIEEGTYYDEWIGPPDDSPPSKYRERVANTPPKGGAEDDDEDEESIQPSGSSNNSSLDDYSKHSKQANLTYSDDKIDIRSVQNHSSSETTRRSSFQGLSPPLEQSGSGDPSLATRQNSEENEQRHPKLYNVYLKNYSRDDFILSMMCLKEFEISEQGCLSDALYMGATAIAPNSDARTWTQFIFDNVTKDCHIAIQILRLTTSIASACFLILTATAEEGANDDIPLPLMLAPIIFRVASILTTSYTCFPKLLMKTNYDINIRKFDYGEIKDKIGDKEDKHKLHTYLSIDIFGFLLLDCLRFVENGLDIAILAGERNKSALFSTYFLLLFFGSIPVCCLNNYCESRLSARLKNMNAEKEYLEEKEKEATRDTELIAIFSEKNRHKKTYKDFIKSKKSFAESNCNDPKGEFYIETIVPSDLSRKKAVTHGNKDCCNCIIV